MTYRTVLSRTEDEVVRLSSYI